MMLGMRLVSLPCRALQASGLALAAACAGVAPSVEEMAARQFEPAASEADRDLAEGHAKSAMQLLEQEQYEAAEDEARQALDLDPRHARARAVLASSMLLAAGESIPIPLAVEREAEGESRSALLLAPGDPFVGLAHARILASSGHLTAAAAAADSCLAASTADGSPAREALVAAAAEWTFELGEDRRAIARLRELSTLRPKEATTHHRLGSCLLRVATDADGAVEASRAFTRCAELEPEDPDAWLAAVKAMLRAAALDPKKPSAFANDAVTLASDAETRFSGSADASFLVGAARDAQSPMSKEAIDAYGRALVRDPEHMPSLLRLVAIAARLQAAGQVDDATATPLPSARDFAARALELDAKTGALDAKERAQLVALRDAKP